MGLKLKMAGSMNGQNKFSIDDAFDENSDEPIRVYGSTTDRSPHISKHKSVDIDSNVTVWVENPGLQRLQAVSDDVRSLTAFLLSNNSRKF